jgi:hypothetical protein
VQHAREQRCDTPSAWHMSRLTCNQIEHGGLTICEYDYSSLNQEQCSHAEVTENDTPQDQGAPAAPFSSRRLLVSVRPLLVCHAIPPGDSALAGVSTRNRTVTRRWHTGAALTHGTRLVSNASRLRDGKVSHEERRLPGDREKELSLRCLHTVRQR